MEKENDKIAHLFRTHLEKVELNVRDGFWEKLSRDITAVERRRHLLFVRFAAAASVLLVLAVSSAAVWYFSPKKELGEAFTQIEAVHRGSLDGDRVGINSLPQMIEPILTKPSSRICKLMTVGDEEDDSLSVMISMSFSFSAISSVDEGEHSISPVLSRYRNNYYKKTANKQQEGSSDFSLYEPIADNLVITDEHNWAVKVQTGFGFPAEHGDYKVPISAGVTVERKLNQYLGIETGILYSNLRSEGLSLHYLGIPMRMNVQLVDKKKVGFYATVGGIADKCITGAFDNSFKKEPVQLSLTAGLGMQYKITKSLSAFVEPSVSHHFDTDSELITIRTKRPTNFNLLCGIRMTY